MVYLSAIILGLFFFFLGYKFKSNNTLKKEKYEIIINDKKIVIEKKNLLKYNNDFNKFKIDWEKQKILAFSEQNGMFLISDQKTLNSISDKIGNDIDIYLLKVKE